jgi:hypothetical protein
VHAATRATVAVHALGRATCTSQAGQKLLHTHLGQLSAFLLCLCCPRSPPGTYNDVVRNDTSSPCKRCPTGTTTVLDGADSIEDCTACAPGYGGPNCATPCGGSVATYGPAGRFLGAECTPCSAAKVGYSYNWNGGMDSFAPTPVARLGASSGYDCLAEFVQVSAVHRGLS